MKFDEFCNKLMVENTDSFESMKEDDDKLLELYYNNPKKYEELSKKLFEKYFSWFDRYSDWEKLKNIMKEKELYSLSDISDRYNRIYKQKMNDIEDKINKGIEDGTIDDKGYDSFGKALWGAWAAGLDNAIDTYRGDDEHPDYWRLAYSSISHTSQFDEREDVQDWYKAYGYGW
jgi:hypothetical protein